jgi:hypothetical protein
VPLKPFIRDLVPPVLWRLMSAVKWSIIDKPPPPPVAAPWQGGATDPGLLGPDDRRFIETRVPELSGWLNTNAAYFAAYMLNVQHKAGIAGPVLEIGVFAGKFLMLLHYLGRRHGNGTVGIDIFTDSDPDAIVAYAEALFGSAKGLRLHEMDSADLTPDSALALLGNERPRAISVDGDHTGPGVLRDLRLCAAILADRGLMILDDVLNPYAAGVAEGTYRFLLDPGCAFVPFAQIENKTFICRRDAHPFYLEAGRQFARDCADLPVARKFLETHAEGAHRVEQDLLGVKTLIFG